MEDQTAAKTLADYIAEARQEQEHGPTPNPERLKALIGTHFGAGIADSIQVGPSDKENALHAAQGTISHGGQEFALWLRREPSGRQTWMLEDEPVLVAHHVERRIDQTANAQALAKRVVEKGG
jgi:hypothetical protein